MIRDYIARFFLRSARGQGLISKVIDPLKDVLDGAVYLFALKGLLGVSLPFYSVIIIVVIKKGLEVFIGYLDEHWGFWKAQNWYESYMLNPYNREVLKTLKRIEDKLK